MIFTSRIIGTARTLGLNMIPFRNLEALAAQISRQAPRCIILDLASSGLRIDDFIQRLRVDCVPTPRVIGYGSHVDAAGLHAARQAGCDLVLPRSKFVEELPTALPDWFSPPERPSLGSSKS
jgi:DNA-binding NarL/FixJ family response regulator